MERKKEYTTRQLELIRQCLIDVGTHMSAEDIVAQLRLEGAGVGIATVYRNLHKLISEGEVQRFTGGDRACFAYAGGDAGCHNHFHLKCTKCGKLIHMECSHMDDLSEHILTEHNFAVDRFNTVLYGVCEDCRK